MKKLDWQEAIRERGTRIRTRGPIQERRVPKTIRTRGAVRTRGTAPVEAAAAVSLEGLVDGLRERANGSHIALVIHCWNGESAQLFLRTVFPSLEENDAVWLVPKRGNELAEAPPELPGAVVLDCSRDTEERTYNNVVVDMVFFPEGQPGDVNKWHRRVEAVIVGKSAKQSSSLVEKAQQNQQEVYLWSDSEPEKLVASWQQSLSTAPPVDNCFYSLLAKCTQSSHLSNSAIDCVRVRARVSVFRLDEDRDSAVELQSKIWVSVSPRSFPRQKRTVKPDSQCPRLRITIAATRAIWRTLNIKAEKTPGASRQETNTWSRAKSPTREKLKCFFVSDYHRKKCHDYRGN